jgi:adenosine deaminase
MKRKNLLIITLGYSWEVIAEVLLISNHKDFEKLGYYIPKEKINPTIQPFDEVWMISTENYNSGIYENIKQFLEIFPLQIKFKFFITKSISDLKSHDDYLKMSNAINLIVHSGRLQFGNNFSLCPTGGRKSMSSDLIQSSLIFGARQIIHIILNGNLNFDANNLSNDFKNIINKDFSLIVYNENLPVSPIYSFIKAEKLQFKVQNSVITTETIQPSTYLHTQIQKLLNESHDIAYNLYNKLNNNELISNFHALYTLDPSLLNMIKSCYYSEKGSKNCFNYTLLKKLPKTDLHCHLGGAFKTSEVIEIANSNEAFIRMVLKSNNNLSIFLERLRCMIKIFNAENSPFENYKMLKRQTINYRPKCTIDIIANMISNTKALSSKYGVDEHLLSISMICCFKENAGLLDYINYKDINSFCKIGIKRFLKLGDIQGSFILKTETSLIQACKILKRNARKHNIMYQEVRCSPYNYVNNSLSAERIIEILHTELASCKHCIFKIIIIGSRHKDKNRLKQHIDLTLNSLDKFDNFIVGFDLAGDEGFAKPEDFRAIFFPLMEKCIRITIHAGEDAPVENIWQAVYHLNAERIGHGLTLKSNLYLREKFINNNIFIEMCPSSNYQIAGYRDSRFPDSEKLSEYPLKEYLDSGLKVTINTDDPGISKTNISNEYRKLIYMSENKIPLWDLLKIIKNGFQGAFIPKREKGILIRKAENEVIKILKGLA